jgi:exosortase/archaeosortase family protein
MMKELKLNSRSMRKCSSFARKTWPAFAFIIPIVLLYASYPGSFEGDTTWIGSWQGRFFYIFFLWLLVLETTLSWETLEKSKINKIGSIKVVILVAVSLLPTIYTVVANFLGANAIIVNLAAQQGIPLEGAARLPLAVEYFVFAALFGAVVSLMYGIHGFKNYSISAFFLVIIGTVYIVDDVYPKGVFTPFQLIVPTTAYLAAGALNLMGYHTLWAGTLSGMPTFRAEDALGNHSEYFQIAWPCAGVESLLIYTVVILLFLKRSAIPWWHKVIYFVIGAIVTYFINVLRIVSIYITSINRGDVGRFHNIYGPLYSIIWIVSYPLIIIGSQLLWSKIKTRRKGTKSGATAVVTAWSRFFGLGPA